MNARFHLFSDLGKNLPQTPLSNKKRALNFFLSTVQQIQIVGHHYTCTLYAETWFPFTRKPQGFLSKLN